MKHLLLLGDSTRMKYEQYVRDHVGMAVDAPEENCRFSTYMLNSLRFWLPNYEKPDVIHFNAGLWDTAILYVDDGPFVPLDLYVRTMKSILRELKRFNVPIVFATSTPVKAELISAVATPSVDAPDAATVFKQSNERIKAYNDAIVAEFEKEGVIINDLYGLVYPHLEEYVSADGIHMNDLGVRVTGEAVVKSVQKALKQ